MSKQKCKKLGNRATKAQIKEAHRAELEMREAMREHNNHFMLQRQPYVLANLSQNHEHWGDTPQQHDERKQKKDLDTEV